MRDTFDDDKLDRLLASASRPEPPAGAKHRLLGALKDHDGDSGGNVIAFRSGRPGRFSLANLSAGGALAASLLLGVYLGANGAVEALMPETVAGIQLSGQSGSDEPLGLNVLFAMDVGDQT